MSTNAPTSAPRIDERLTHLLDELDPATYAALEAEILAGGGPRDALVVWKEQNVLLDGRHRMRICSAHGLPYRVEPISLPDEAAARDWVARNQLARRNLTPAQASYWRGKLLQAQRKDQRANLSPGKQESPKPQTEASGKTASRIAAQTGVSRATVERDAQFATAVDAVVAAAPPADRPKVQAGLLSGALPLRQRDVVDLSKTRVVRDEDMTWEALVQHGKDIVKGRRPAKPSANPNAPFITRGVKPETLETYVDGVDGQTYADRVQLTCGHWHTFIRRVAAARGKTASSFPCTGCGSGTRKAHVQRMAESHLRRNFDRAMMYGEKRDHVFRFVSLGLELLTTAPTDEKALERIREELARTAHVAGLYDSPERGTTSQRMGKPRGRGTQRPSAQSEDE